jgi:hypothetical protein
MPDAALCSGGSLWLRFPAFSAPIAALRLLVAPVVIALRYAPSFLCFAGGGEISRVPGQPLSTCSGLRPRRSLSVDAASTESRSLDRCGLPLRQQRRPPQLRQFRGSIPQPMDLLSTLRRRPRGRTTQDSLPVAGPSAFPVGTFTRGSLQKVSAYASSSSELGSAQCLQPLPGCGPAPAPDPGCALGARTQRNTIEARLLVRLCADRGDGEALRE